MRENEYQIVIQFVNIIKSSLMSLWYSKQIKIHYFLKTQKWE